MKDADVMTQSVLLYITEDAVDMALTRSRARPSQSTHRAEPKHIDIDPTCYAAKLDHRDDDAEELEEAAELSSVGNVAMPAGDDGKSSPTAGKNDMGGKAVDMSAKSADGKSKGLTSDAKDMNVTHPGDGAKLSAETKGHGAEKKGKAE